MLSVVMNMNWTFSVGPRGCMYCKFTWVQDIGGPHHGVLSHGPRVHDPMDIVNLSKDLELNCL